MYSPLTSDTWEATDGTILPMTQAFWYPGRPNNILTEHCLWLPLVKDYYFDDTLCDTTFAYVICETD